MNMNIDNDRVINELIGNSSRALETRDALLIAIRALLCDKTLTHNERVDARSTLCMILLQKYSDPNVNPHVETLCDTIDTIVSG